MPRDERPRDRRVPWRGRDEHHDELRGRHPDPARGAEQAARRTLPADKAAQIILDGMERNAYRVMVGNDARMMDALYRINPSGAASFIARQMKDLLGRS